LKERLHRWTRAGQYGFLFDNDKDTLTFSRFQTFNFHGWGDTPELLEPLLFYVLHRASREIRDPARLASFKAFLLDESWLLICDLVPPSQMLIRKHDGSKKVHLNVDPLSYWMATNNARDNVIKNEYLDRYGITEGLQRLAQECPFPPNPQLRHQRDDARPNQAQLPAMKGARR